MTNDRYGRPILPNHLGIITVRISVGAHNKFLQSITNFSDECSMLRRGEISVFERCAVESDAFRNDE